MPIGTRVRHNTYVDSVTLMAVSRQVAGLDGVSEAVAAMATDLNKDLLNQVGLLTPEARAAGPPDLVLAVDAESAAALEAALEAAERLLSRPAAGAVPGAAAGEAAAPRTLKTARRLLSDANLALVSVPGAYAGYQARLAVLAGLHVMCYSSEVPVAVEAELKRLAHARGLLFMGPDCGTALLDGVGLGLANAVRRGPVGIVAASGSGAQELSTLVHRLASGVSHCIGTGGRDGSAEVGGLMLADALERLQDDPDTGVVVLLSKPPAAEVAARLLARARAGPKPVVACLLGTAGGGGSPAAGTVDSIDRAAVRAVHLATGRPEAELEAALGHGRPAGAPAPGPPPGAGAGRRYLRGLFSGGTLCQQALEVVEARLGPAWSNVHPDPGRRGVRSVAERSRENTLIDLGEAAFVAGRPHPIIDPTVRRVRLRAEAADPEVAVILLDVVLGHGCHPDPAGALAEEVAAARVNGIAVVASITGTDDDPQGRTAQARALEAAGAAVAPTARLAAEAAVALAGGGR